MAVPLSGYLSKISQNTASSSLRRKRPGALSCLDGSRCGIKRERDRSDAEGRSGSWHLLESVLWIVLPICQL